MLINDVDSAALSASYGRAAIQQLHQVKRWPIFCKKYLPPSKSGGPPCPDFWLVALWASWLCPSCLRHSDCVTHDTDGRTKGVGDFRTRITNTTTTPQIRNRKLLTTYSPICDIPLVVVVASYIICQRQFVQYSLTRQILSSLLVKTFGAVFVGETNKKMVETFVGRTNHCLVDAVNAAELPVKESKMQEEAEKTMQWSLHQGVVCAVCSLQYALCTMEYALCTMHFGVCTMECSLCSSAAPKFFPQNLLTSGCHCVHPGMHKHISAPLTLSIHPLEMRQNCNKPL